MIDASLREKLKGLEKCLCESILGQEEVIGEIAPILINGELGINSEGKPKANLLLLGPPGVGKTDICNVFTDYLLGSEKLIRFDMSEYQTVESIYRLGPCFECKCVGLTAASTRLSSAGTPSEREKCCQQTIYAISRKRVLCHFYLR
jgi:hypothetical protein